ncbi:16S rRNA (cytidine(1402)-2'-O)-methyltransferase [Candidatus Spongiihabitans sp.]|uniref:16S rRNA (cytidine(1402)-2'-O)-methyltransferase n=1 Tax=Candidatus Spongiihabitans sp. TaxID=3101308 RepID=UPI003C799F55
MNGKIGSLFVVATPIGNLGDITERAIAVLTQAALILAEDTRHTGKLLSHFGISTKTKSFHQHNERAHTPKIIGRLQAGEDIALVSDAGTPLISDPGFCLVRAARTNGISVSPIPGASALTAALCASGLATDRFCFEGFLPAKSQPRRQRLQQLRNENRTVVFYESSHRIIASLHAMAESFGQDREATIAREISKKFETFYFGGIARLIAQMEQNPRHQKGEFVIVVSASARDAADANWDNAIRLLQSLIVEMPAKTACKIAGDTFGVNKNKLYRVALEDKNSDSG